MTPRIKALDHLVLSVADMDATVGFYTEILGMEVETFVPADGQPRLALRFGMQKINLHAVQTPYSPHARNVQAGSADLCFLSDTSLKDWHGHLSQHGVDIEQGPVRRTGAQTALLSIYLRDPDGNLIEISNQMSGQADLAD